MKEFELPTNIRQIGGISDGLRIYMEDYVFTYLRQIAESGENTERTAFLVGKHLVVDAQPTIFINGALQAVYTETVEGIEQFSEKSFTHAQEQIDMYFKGYEIVGWMLSQPGFGVSVNASYADYHITNFNKTHHALFVMDPVQKINTFYTWDKDHKKVEECRGYFVYYKQNEGMQEYMLNNKIASTKPKKPPIIKPGGNLPITRVERPDRKSPYEKPSYMVNNGRGEKRREEPREEQTKKEDTPQQETVRHPMRRSYAPEVSNPDQKRITNILVSLSAVLFIICFIMGAGLIQSDGRINRLEQEVTSLNQANEFMSSQIRQIAAMEVFASTPTVQTTPTPTQAPTQTPLPIQTPFPTEVPGALATAPPLPTPPTEPPTAPPTALSTPSPTQPPAVSVEYRMYMVQPNDTLFSINQNFFGSINRMEEIMELNEMEDPNRVVAGVEIRIPY